MNITTVSADVSKYGATAVRRAQEYVQTIEHSFIEMLNIPSSIAQSNSNGVLESITVLPGISVQADILGPSPHRIMMIGCWPNKLESDDKRLLKGEWVTELKNLLHDSK